MSDIDPKFVMHSLGQIVAANPADALAALAVTDGRSLAAKLTAMPADMKFAIAGIKFTRDGPAITMHDKVRSLEMMARCLGMLADRMVLAEAQKPPIPLITDDMTAEQAANIWAEMIGAKPYR